MLRVRLVRPCQTKKPSISRSPPARPRSSWPSGPVAQCVPASTALSPTAPPHVLTPAASKDHGAMHLARRHQTAPDETSRGDARDKQAACRHLSRDARDDSEARLPEVRHVIIENSY